MTGLLPVCTRCKGRIADVDGDWMHQDLSAGFDGHVAVPAPVVQVFPRERTEGQRVALTGTLLILVGVGLAGVGRVLRGRL